MATKTKPNREKMTTNGHMVRTSHDLPEDARKQMVNLLNENMADLFDLFSQTKQAHWNVKGPQFYSLHELYDELAETLLGHIDTVAERATALGGVATGTVRMAAQATRIPEFPGTAVGSRESVELLVQRYAGVAKSTREAIDEAEKAEDMVTSDLFIEVTHSLDKGMWFLEAHVQQGE